MKSKTISRQVCTIVICLLFLSAVPMTGATLEAAEKSSGKNPARFPKTGWSVISRGGYVYQKDTAINSGGSFSVNRFFIQAGPAYIPDRDRSISLAVGYGFDNYTFSGDTGFGGLAPWETVHSLRFSIPFRWRLSDRWTGFASPALRFTGENGADLKDAMTGGVFAGFSYRFSDRLSIGPGFGILTQLEESAWVIPILVIKWKISDTLSLSTGQGVGATLGPGLTLNWRVSRSWSLSVGGRSESLRFRLAEDGTVPNGIGDDQSFPIFGGIEYRFSPMARITFMGGVETGGELSLEDENGQTIFIEKHDPAGFFGIAFSAMF